jgi:peroxiredoxin
VLFTVAGLFLAGIPLLGAVLPLYQTPPPAPPRYSAAPDFVLTDQAGASHHLADYLGRAVILAFLPNGDANTRAELRSLQSVSSELDLHGIKLFGINTESAAANARLRQEERLDFPLLSDPEGKTAAAYGVKSRLGGLRRATVIVGPGGLLDVTVKAVQPERHAEQVLPLVQCCLEEFADKPSRALGQRLPNYVLRNVVSGKQETLYGPGSPDATVVVFISSECPCSRGYDARLAELARKYGQEQVRFVGINASPTETWSEIADHARQIQFPFPVLRDPRQVVMQRLEARMTPEVFVADSQGFVRYHGRIDDNRLSSQVRRRDLQEALDRLVAGKQPLRAEATPFGCAIPQLTTETPTTEASNGAEFNANLERSSK